MIEILAPSIDDLPALGDNWGTGQSAATPREEKRRSAKRLRVRRP